MIGVRVFNNFTISVKVSGFLRFGLGTSARDFWKLRLWFLIFAIRVKVSRDSNWG